MERIGLISDTHGLLRPEAFALLAGCQRIIHAGDIGNGEILARLATIAPLTVVRGNNDWGTWAAGVPHTATLTVEQVRIHVLHDISELDEDSLRAGVRVVVYGHSHKPSVREQDGIVYVNPGSAGPRRFTLPVTVGELLVEGATVSARILDLKPPS